METGKIKFYRAARLVIHHPRQGAGNFRFRFRISQNARSDLAESYLTASAEYDAMSANFQPATP